MKQKRSLILAMVVANFVLGGSTLAHAATAAQFDLGTFVVDKGVAPSQYDAAYSESPTVYAGGQVARVNRVGNLGEKSFVETPFNITGYTDTLIENQQAQSINEVVANDPSVTQQNWGTGANSWTIRGLDVAGADVSLNGLYGIAPITNGTLDNAERVEVFKGPSAMLNGMSGSSNVGGSINIVTKRAKDVPTKKMTIGFDGNAQYRQSLDLGQRFGDHKQYGVRLNVSNKKGNTYWDNEVVKNQNVTLGMDYKGSDKRIGIDAGIISNKTEAPVGTLRFSRVIAAANQAGADTTYLNPNTYDTHMSFSNPDMYKHVNERFLAVKGEHDFAKHWTGFVGFGWRHTNQDYAYSTADLANLAGSLRVMNSWSQNQETANTQEIGVRGTFNTGAITHEIVASANRQAVTVHNRSGSVQAVSMLDLKNLVWPTLATNFKPSSDVPKTSESVFSGVGITDVISTKDKAWQLMMGVRYQHVKRTAFNATTGAVTSTYSEGAVTPGFGVVHKFNDKVAVYANYIQGLSRGNVVSSYYKNAGEILPVYKTTQREVGLKFDAGKFTTTVSAFSVKKPNIIDKYLVPGGGRGQEESVIAGETDNKGLEVNFFGEPKLGTRILGGVMYLKSVVHNAEEPASDGKYSAAVPRWTAVLGVEQDIKSVKGLTVNARMTYNGSVFLNDINTYKIAPWTRVDLGARYTWNAGHTPMTVRADVYNLFDKTYWEGRVANRVNLAKGRTLGLSLTAEF